MLGWVTHKGKRILVGRFTGLDDAGCIALIDQAEREILTHSAEPGSVLFLTCGATSMNDKLIQRWKDFGVATKSVVKATALEGLPFFVRAVAKLMKPDMYFAASEQEALDWLAER